MNVKLRSNEPCMTVKFPLRYFSLEVWDIGLDGKPRFCYLHLNQTQNCLMETWRKALQQLALKSILEIYEDEEWGEIRYLKECCRCGKHYESSRIDAASCSEKCKQSLWRMSKKGVLPLLGKKWRGNKEKIDQPAMQAKIEGLEKELGEVKGLLGQVLGKLG